MPPFTVKVRYWLMTVPYTVPLYYVLQMNTHTNLNTQGYNILMGHHKRTLNLGNNVMFFFFGGRGNKGKKLRGRLERFETIIRAAWAQIKLQFYDHNFSIENYLYLCSDFIRGVIGCVCICTYVNKLFTALYYCLLELYIISTSVWLNQYW